jgi:hypothetical protein
MFDTLNWETPFRLNMRAIWDVLANNNQNKADDVKTKDAKVLRWSRWWSLPLSPTIPDLATSNIITQLNYLLFCLILYHGSVGGYVLKSSVHGLFGWNYGEKF